MKSHRPERIANVVRDVVSEAIATKLSDPRIAPFASVTRVEMSADLEYAKVWISVLGEEKVQRLTIAGLQSAAGVVQRMLAKDLTLRHCPRLSFHLDESIKRAAETIRLIDAAMAELQASDKQTKEDVDLSGDDA